MGRRRTGRTNRVWRERRERRWLLYSMSLKGRRCIPVVTAKEAAEEEVTARMKSREPLNPVE